MYIYVCVHTYNINGCIVSLHISTKEPYTSAKKTIYPQKSHTSLQKSPTKALQTCKEPFVFAGSNVIFLACCKKAPNLCKEALNFNKRALQLGKRNPYLHQSPRELNACVTDLYITLSSISLQKSPISLQKSPISLPKSPTFLSPIPL